MRRGPQGGGAHQEIAVATDRYRQPVGPFEGERRTHRDAGPAAYAAAAVAADEVERVPEGPPGTVPRERQMEERRVAASDHLAQHRGKVLDAKRTCRIRLGGCAVIC